MANKTIELYKKRDFGEKINATIEFIRIHFGPLLKMTLVIVIPLGVLASLTFSNFFGLMSGVAGRSDMSQDEASGVVGQLGVNYLLMMVISLLTYVLLIAAIYGYMRQTRNQPSPNPIEELKKSFVRVPGLIALFLLIGIVSFIGFLIFIIPGIYLMVVL